MPVTLSGTVPGTIANRQANCLLALFSSGVRQEKTNIQIKEKMLKWEVLWIKIKQDDSIRRV